MELFLEIIGWIGTILIVSAFYLNITKKIQSSSRLYQLMNIVGSILLGSNLYYKSAWSGMTLQVIWIMIALYGMYQSYKENAVNKQNKDKEK